MTVSSDNSKVQYTAPGGPADYNVTFQFFAASDLVVVVTVAGVDAVKVLGTDYTVTGGDNEVGKVTGSFPAGATVTIYREMPYTQETEFEEGGDLPASSLNDLADRLVMLMQQLKTLVGRAVVLPVSSALTQIFFPDAAPGKFLRWNADGTGFENADVTDLGSIGVPIAPEDGGTGLTSLDDLWAAIFERPTAAEKLAGTEDSKAVTVAVINQELIAARLASFTLSR